MPERWLTPRGGRCRWVHTVAFALDDREFNFAIAAVPCSRGAGLPAMDAVNRLS